ncbi:DUF6265 family protein [Sphingopyxis indica]|uniref:DUF6265 domain-containing protein n=1 Tax=Sphingopyxis indica TaxID=436663 RepID=A0A239IVV2_9SPHN|nr:DUF6265 family protein [Sphingopyxis indica]SNS97760.1 hypothetical protein SAMN06295955_108191 [Sphingopyxis indica]
MKIQAMLAAIALTASAPACAQVADLAWLSGEWMSDAGGVWTEERWSIPRGGMMLGTSLSVKADKVLEFEFLRIETDRYGKPTYVAQPRGGSPVYFPLIRMESGSATFENPKHDFPQRITYIRDGQALTATISLMDGSNAISWTFNQR